MKNHTTVRHGMLDDLEKYLVQSGWTIEDPVGKYEVLRARRKGYPRPLLIHERERGCGYSIDERDERVYKGWKKSRSRRGLDPHHATTEERESKAR